MPRAPKMAQLFERKIKFRVIHFLMYSFLTLEKKFRAHENLKFCLKHYY